jgi:hypothetical protein
VLRLRLWEVLDAPSSSRRLCAMGLSPVGWNKTPTVESARDVVMKLR